MSEIDDRVRGSEKISRDEEQQPREGQGDKNAGRRLGGAEALLRPCPCSCDGRGRLVDTALKREGDTEVAAAADAEHAWYIGIG